MCVQCVFCKEVVSTVFVAKMQLQLYISIVYILLKKILDGTH